MLEESALSASQWVDKYADELFRYTIVRINDAGYSEDIVQETLLSAWKARNTFKKDASEKTWLFSICKNKIIDHLRKRHHKITFVENEEDIYFDAVGHWKEGPTPKEWDINYDLPLETKEFYSVLQHCKSKLKSLQQDIFVMKYMEDMKSENICKVLNISPSNYWVLVHRCKLQLRSCLEKNWLNIN